nr:hypothetical protein Iba_chr13fCG6910 [Ipomoea batatas]
MSIWHPRRVVDLNLNSSNLYWISRSFDGNKNISGELEPPSPTARDLGGGWGGASRQRRSRASTSLLLSSPSNGGSVGPSPVDGSRWQIGVVAATAFSPPGASLFDGVLQVAMQWLVLNGGDFPPAGVRIALMEHPPPFGGSSRAQRCISLRSPSSGANGRQQKRASILRSTRAASNGGLRSRLQHRPFFLVNAEDEGNKDLAGQSDNVSPTAAPASLPLPRHNHGGGGETLSPSSLSTAVNGQGCNSSADRGSSTDGDGITFCVPDDEQQQRAAALISSSVSDERATTAEIDPSLSLVLAARAAVMAVTRTSKQRQRQNRAVASFPVAPGVIASIHRCGSLLHSLLERSTATAEQSSGVQVAEHPGGPDTPVTFFRSTKRQLQRRG